MIADAVPASGAVPAVDLDGGGGLVGTNGTAMNDNKCNCTHKQDIFLFVNANSRKLSVNLPKIFILWILKNLRILFTTSSVQP